MSRVVRFHRTGDAQVLQIDEVDVSAPKAGEVQIRVKALGINRAEIMYRTGQYVIEPRFPAILGYEAAGLVEALGPDVAGFNIGDAVSVVPRSEEHTSVLLSRDNLICLSLCEKKHDINL